MWMNVSRTAAMSACLVALAACGRGDDVPAPAPSASPSRVAAVAFDPAFTPVAGSWRSKPGSIEGGRYLQVDVASGGGYTIDVRRASGATTEVSETGRGEASARERVFSASPGEQQGAYLKALGAWTAEFDEAARVLTLKGANGVSVTLERAG